MSLYQLLTEFAEKDILSTIDYSDASQMYTLYIHEGKTKKISWHAPTIPEGQLVSMVRLLLTDQIESEK